MRATASLLLILIFSTALAHQESDSFLTIALGEDGAEVRWDVSLVDLEEEAGVDRDGNGIIQWREILAGEASLFAFAFGHVRISDRHYPCAPLANPLKSITERGNETFLVMRWRIRCHAESLDYDAFFDRNANHRGFVNVIKQGANQTFVASPSRSRFEFASERSGFLTFASYWRTGWSHILEGFDHLLFLFCLLLPVVLPGNVKLAGATTSHQAIRRLTLELAKIVTAFTAAHSITLALTVFELIQLPIVWVEVAIATTVILVAVNNIWPRFHRAGASIAFGLGLIHGLGFANVLRELALTGDALWIALLGFNLGVESGQLAIACMLLPIAFFLRSTRLYEFGIVRLGSLAIAILALTWAVERVGVNHWLNA
ncbi:MAG: HupE/UreJ family protein [Pseudomonadota bacterium]